MTSKRKTTRRDFLKGKSAANALTDLHSVVDPANHTQRDAADRYSEQSPLSDRTKRRQSDRRDYLLQVERKAMGCHFQVFLNAGQHDGAVEAALDALNLIESLETQLSVFQADSEICQINRLPAQQTHPVEPRLFDLLNHCLELSRTTDGAFDITASPLVSLWNIRGRKGRVPDREKIEEAMQRVGSHHVVLDETRTTVLFRTPGIELNLGSVGKGYALDRSAEILEAAEVDDYIIHGGHSSILAHGTRSGRGEDGGWSVALPNPLRPERRLAEVQLNDQAIGTSGSGRQFFYHRGRRYGHVLDPRTGRPAEGVLSATVLSNSATEADALATAFFVMGVEATERYCDQRPDLSVIFVCPGQRQGTVSITTLNVKDQLHLANGAD